MALFDCYIYRKREIYIQREGKKVNPFEHTVSSKGISASAETPHGLLLSLSHKKDSTTHSARNVSKEVFKIFCKWINPT